MVDPQALSTPPPEYEAEAIELPPLEIGPTLEHWQVQRRQVLETWLDYLGQGPEVVPLEPEVQEEQDLGEVTRSLVSYQVEEGCRVEAYLIRPKAEGPHPGVVVYHPTTNDTILQPAGLAPPPEKHFGLKLAQRGYVTLSPRNYLWEYMGLPRRDSPAEERMKIVEKLFERSPQWTGMGKMVWDGLRAVDYLLTLPGVDPERLGCVGHSLGAKEVIYSLALDERLQAGVSSEGGVGISFSNWDAPWYLGERIHTRPDLDHHQLVALCAPSALLVLGGGEPGGRSRPHGGADRLESWNYLEAARPAYALHGASEKLGMLLHHKGHAVPPEAEAALYAWLDRYLGSH
jgi:dienelactone hydrolase